MTRATAPPADPKAVSSLAVPAITSAATAGAGPILGRVGSLLTRLALTPAEIARAQALRFQVFHRELGARSTPAQARAARDLDPLDAHCDHLLVIDEAADGALVATYRLLDAEGARAAGGWYSAAEFDLTALTRGSRSLLELGRSCVAPAWRNRRTMELLWHGAWSLALHKRIDTMFGCASLPGTEAGAHGAALAFLHHHARAAPDRDAPATGGTVVRLADHGATPFDPRRALASLPPLVKGYLRLGARVAGEAHVDAAFGCIDLLVTLDVAAINPRYLAHYGVDASRFRR